MVRLTFGLPMSRNTQPESTSETVARAGASSLVSARLLGTRSSPSAWLPQWSCSFTPGFGHAALGAGLSYPLSTTRVSPAATGARRVDPVAFIGSDDIPAFPGATLDDDEPQPATTSTASKGSDTPNRLRVHMPTDPPRTI